MDCIVLHWIASYGMALCCIVQVLYCMYVFACVYVYTNISVHIYTRRCIDIGIDVDTRLRIHNTYLHTQICVRIYVFKYIYTCMYLWIFASQPGVLLKAVQESNSNVPQNHCAARIVCEDWGRRRGFSKHQSWSS